jgi:hypothetical protein
MVFINDSKNVQNFFFSIGHKMSRKDLYLYANYLPPGSGSVIQDYGSADSDPDPIKIFKDPSTAVD